MSDEPAGEESGGGESNRRAILERGAVLGTGAIVGTGCRIGAAAGAADGSDTGTARDGADDGDGADGGNGTDDAESVRDLPLVDAHTHVLPESTFGRAPVTPDELVTWMDDNGVDRAVVQALDSPEGFPVTSPSWWILDRISDHTDRLLPFCTVDPRTFVYERDAVVAVLERYVERGARGFGELKAGLAVDDDRLHTVYELCAEYELPVLFHHDEKSLYDDVGLPAFEDVFASYPSVDFLGHGQGWWAHVSADVTASEVSGYPEGPVEPGGRVSELLGAYDNVYGDLSAGSGWNALVRDREYGQSFLERYHDSLVFGTDYLAREQRVPQFRLFERFDLEREAWANVRYRTLEGVLR